MTTAREKATKPVTRYVHVTVDRAWVGEFRLGETVERFERQPTSGEYERCKSYALAMGATEDEAREYASFAQLQGPGKAAAAMESRTGVPAKAFLDALNTHGWPE